MAFGKTLEQNQKTQKTPQSNNPVYLSLSEGKTVFRVLTREVQFKVVWLDFVMVNGKPSKRPIIVGVLDGMFAGPDGEYFASGPIHDWIQNKQAELTAEYAQTGIEAEQIDKKVQAAMSKYWPKTRFYVNVFDRTPVIREALESGYRAHYPGSNGKYAIAGTAEPHNAVQVIDQSAGREGGKHFLQQLVTVSETMMSMRTGEPITIYDGDLQCVTKGREIETTRVLSMSINQDPVIITQIYDIWGFVKPWSHEAQQAILDGQDYNEVRREHNIPFMPQLIDVEDLSEYR